MDWTRQSKPSGGGYRLRGPRVWQNKGGSVDQAKGTVAIPAPADVLPAIEDLAGSEQESRKADVRYDLGTKATASRRTTSGEHVFGSLPCMGSSGSLAVRRAARKQAHLTTARACGGRFARACEHGVDPAVFLKQCRRRRLTSAERRAKAGLLPATWRAAFGQGWRSA